MSDRNSSTLRTGLATCSVLPFPAEFLLKVRTMKRDDQDLPVKQFVSEKGGEPLRDLRRRAKAGEKVILGSFQLFSEAGPYREFGPVFISGEENLPMEPDIFATNYLREKMALRAYSRQFEIAEAKLGLKEDIPSQVETWLSDPRIGFVDARFPEYGCFACRFVRADTMPGAIDGE